MKTKYLSLKATFIVLLMFKTFVTPSLVLAHSDHQHRELDNWPLLANGTHKVGKSHGDIAVSKDGQFYVSTMSDKTQTGGIKKYDKNGRFIDNVPNAPDDFHSFVIHQDTNGREYIYGASLKHKKIIKMDLEGQLQLSIDADKAIPLQFHQTQKNKHNLPLPSLKLSGIDVDQQGNIYTVDGYSLDFIHKFNSKGEYISSFGGKGEPYNFDNCHKIRIDPRFTPNRLICADRKNGRLVHLSLEGDLMSTYAKNLRRPSAIAFYGEYAAVAEISGRVSLIDKSGTTVNTFGTNNIQHEINTNTTKPNQWRNDVLTAPHGITFDHKGNLYITEWNKWGRIVRFNLNE